MKTSPNQTVEPTGAPRWHFHAPGESKVPCFGWRQVRAPVAHFFRSIIALIAVLIFNTACVTNALAVHQKVGTTKGTPEVWEELRVVLERADYVDTVRLQATYLFRVTERVHETFGFHPHGFPPPPGSDPDTFSLRLSQGSDVDDTGRDSIDRLNWLFDAGAPEPRAGFGSPMTIGNTNCVTLRVFSSIWLFSDTPGRAIAIDYSRRNRQWGSRQIIELFGGLEPAPFIYLSRHIDGRSMTLLEHKELEVRLAAIHALPTQSEDAMEHLTALLQDKELEIRLAVIRVLPTQGKAAIKPLLEHFCLHAEHIMDRAQIIGTRVEFVSPASRWHYRQAEASVRALRDFGAYADHIVPRLRPYEDAGKYSPQLARSVGEVLRALEYQQRLPAQIP